MVKLHNKILLAKKQNDIIKRIFDGVQKDAFDIDLHLDKIGVKDLKNFWLYTSGILSVQNVENNASEISADVARDMLSGRFCVKKLNNNDIENLKKQYGISNTQYAGKRIIPLYAIKDGICKIEKVVDENSRQVHTNLVLETSPVSYFIDGKPVSLDGSDEEILAHYYNLRNIIVHSTPFLTEDKSQIVFLGKQYDQEKKQFVDETMLMSKMWLRGFSEMFADTHTKFDAVDFENKLLWDFFDTDNIVDERGIERALLSLKKHLPQSIADNLGKEMLYLVKDNIVCYDKFYEKSHHEQAKILSNLLVNHIALDVKYPKTMNLPIIYKLQQLVANTVNKKEQELALKQNVANNADAAKIKALVDKINEEKAKLEHALKYNNYGTTERAKIFAAINKLNAQLKVVSDSQKHIMTMNKSETLNMDLFDPEGLRYLPVEVGFNIMCLAAYNALITSGFYEDVLHNIDFKQMSFAHYKLIRQIKLDGLTYTHKPYNVIKDAAANVPNTAYLLECMRNALVHGNVSYKVPTELYDKNPSFADAMVTFKSHHGKVLVHGKMADFFKLFVSEGFYIGRYRLAQELAENKDAEYIRRKEKTDDDQGQPGGNE